VVQAEPFEFRLNRCFAAGGYHVLDKEPQFDNNLQHC
jgi:hypothetical protein